MLIEQRLRPAASSGGETSQAEQWFLQGRRYHQGDGVPSNYAEAIRLYQLAAANGSARARRMLELIFSRPSPDGGVDIAWMQQVSRMQVAAPGAVTLLPPTTVPSLKRDPSPLYDLVPPEWRTPGRP
jgi:TPR repeat protein